MLKIAFLSLVVISVSAGSSSSSSSAAPAVQTAPSMIPTDVSSTCSTFLQALDTDAGLQSCLSAVLSATDVFSSSTTSSNAQTALSGVCSSSTQASCSPTLFRKKLSAFYAACPKELTGSATEASVKAIYDTMYIVAPFLSASCTKDASTNNYCAATLGAAASSADLSLAQTYLSQGMQAPLAKRASAPEYITPNTTTFAATGLPFFFLTPSTPSTTLCSACAQSVLSSYMSFESSEPYAMGLTNSPLLGGQKAIWDQASSTCGAAWSGVAANAGAGPAGDPAGVAGALGSGSIQVRAGMGGVVAALLAAFVAL